MASGQNLRERFRFERRGAGQAQGGQPQSDGMGGLIPVGDGMGGGADAWGLLSGPFRARLRPINGREEVLDGKLSGVQPFELLVRYCAATAAVTTADRAVDDRTGVAYDVCAVQNTDERRQWLSMIVKRGEPSNG